MDKKKLRNDIILVTSLLLVAAISLVVVILTRNTKSNVASIYVENNVVERVDLSSKEDGDYYIEGTKGILHVRRHNHAIAVIESNCPHQDCVHMGYVKRPNTPIICTYNAVSIVIDGESLNDVEI